MNATSYYDDLGFIPYEKESLEEYLKRCEEVLSCEDKIKRYFGNKCELLDSEEECKLINELYKAKPTWIPVVKKESKFSYGKTRIKDFEKLKIPVVYVEKNDVGMKFHELVHAFRIPVANWSFYKMFLFGGIIKNDIEEEVIACYSAKKCGIDGTTKYPNYPRQKVLLNAMAFPLIASALFAIPPNVLSVYLGSIYGKNFFDSLNAGLEIKKWPVWMKEIEDKFGNEKGGYLIGRLKTEEIKKFAKEMKKGKNLDELLRKISGLRGEIIKTRI